MAGNSMYSTVPGTAPGLDGLRHTIGDVVASVTGDMTAPYVAPNQSVYEAMMAKHVNGALYRTMTANTYSQLGRQIGNTLGGMEIVQQLGSMAGVSPSEMRRMLSGGGASAANGFFGSMLMPLLDSGMAGMGLTGGSIIAAANNVYGQRMNLLSPGVLLNPTNVGQQHQAMGAASAFSSLLNGLMSQSRDGQMTLLPNLAMTQGFDRERVAGVMMKAAGRGMFTSYADVEGLTSGGLAKRMVDAAGGLDLTALDFALGDFTNGKNSVLSKEGARKMQDIGREVGHRMKGVTEAMAAMRDLTHEVDGIEDKLDALTNGDWLRSGKAAYAARDSLRKLQSVAAANNLSSTEALGNLAANRGVLQNAAGFDQSMLALGFDGGGMFGLDAQVGLLADVEDMITARGVRGDPMLANRLRNQSRQALSRNMNSMAGRGAQVLAYARQQGIVSDSEAQQLQGALASGDRGIMGATLNRLFTTVFGSAEAGRRFVNDQMQMNAMRQSMNDEAGGFAWRTMIRGADAEMGRRAEITASQQRLEFSKQLLGDSGMRTWQSDADVGRLVDSVEASLKDIDGDALHLGREFRAQYNRHIKEGKKPLAAFTATKEAFARNPALAAYTEVIDHAVTRQAATNNEYRLQDAGNGGSEAYYATKMSQTLVDAGIMTNDERLEVAKMLKNEEYGRAYQTVYGKVSAIKDADTRFLYKKSGWKLMDDYEKSEQHLKDNQAAEQIIAKANYRQYGAGQAAQAYRDVVTAARDYFRAGGGGEAYADFLEQFSHSKFGAIFGKDEQKNVIDALKRGDTEFFDTMGRQSAAVERIDVENLKENGYSLQLKGYWGDGAYAGNSDAARKRRNEVVNDIARGLVESGQLDAGRASTMAQDIASMFLGNKNWRQVLKLYGGNSDLESRFSAFTKKFDLLEGAKQKAVELSKSEDYRNALRTVSQMEGGRDKLEHLFERINQGVVHGSDVEDIKALLNDNGITGDSEPHKAIMKYVEALHSVAHKQRSVEKTIGKAVREDGFVDSFTPVKERADKSQSVADKLLGDSDLSSFLSGLDMSEYGVEEAKGKLKDAFSLLNDVSVDDAAKALNRESAKGMNDEEFRKGALKVIKKQASEGDDSAITTLRAFKAASTEGVQKIRGEITIRSGNDSSPAVLDGNVGGL